MSASESQALPAAVQLFIQKLMIARALDSHDAEASLKAIYEVVDNEGLKVPDVIALANKNLGYMKLAIKTIKLDATDSGAIWHTFVNTASDSIAKKYGSRRSSEQTDAYKQMVAAFGKSENYTLTGDDFDGMRPAGFTIDQYQDYIQELVEEFWLRTANGEDFRLGVRAYAELSDLLESHNIPIPQALHY